MFPSYPFNEKSQQLRFWITEFEDFQFPHHLVPFVGIHGMDQKMCSLNEKMSSLLSASTLGQALYLLWDDGIAMDRHAGSDHIR